MDVSLSIPVKNFVINPLLPFWVKKLPTNLRLAMAKAKIIEVQDCLDHQKELPKAKEVNRNIDGQKSQNL